MSTPRTKTHELIRIALAGEALTGAEIAQRAGIALFGTESALKGMWRRGEVSRLKQRTRGEPYRYRMSSAA